MPRSLRWTSCFALILAVSGCCSLLGTNIQGFAGPFAAVAFDSDGSDVGVGGDYACDCPKVAGLKTGLGGMWLNSNGGSYLVGQLFAAYALGTSNQLAFNLLGSGLVKRHSYSNDYNVPGEFSGGGSSLFQAVDGSSTDFGISIGGEVTYGAFEKAIPFASLERYQVGGGGFQVLRLGSRWSVGS